MKPIRQLVGFLFLVFFVATYLFLSLVLVDLTSILSKREEV